MKAPAVPGGDGDRTVAPPSDHNDRQIRLFLEATRRLNGQEIRERDAWNTTVTIDAIRHFAYGTSDDNPLWLDPSYAARTRFRCPVAPPAFLASVLYPVLHGAPVETPLSNLISELTFWWHSPVFEGDCLRGTARQVAVTETMDRNGETLICIDSETNYWNQRDECVAKATCTLTRARQKKGALRVERGVYRYREEELEAIAQAQKESRRSGYRPLDSRRIGMGDQLPPLVRGPLTLGDLVCWQAAIGPAYRSGALGYQDALAAPHAFVQHPVTGWPVKDSQQHEDFLLAAQRGMPLPFDNGVMRFAWICPLLTDWMGDEGTLQRFTVRLIGPNLYGDTTWYRGTIVRKTHLDDGLLTGIRVVGTNQLGETTTIGDADVLLPFGSASSSRVPSQTNNREDPLPSAERASDSVTALIRQQAIRHPSKDAVLAGELRLPYAQLITRVDRLASSLRQRGVVPETTVGALFERSADYAVSALGVWEAGATLLPLDSTYPIQRLQRIADDAAPEFLLASEALRDRIPRTRAELMTLENLALEPVKSPPDKVPPIGRPGRTAYVLYTSGSTREPLGVTVPHASLARYIASLPEALGVNEDDVFLHTASFAFSASMRQLLIPLCLGATLIIANDDERVKPQALFELIRRRGATVWDTVPALWQVSIETLLSLPAGERRELLDHRLRLILLTGEALTWDLPDAWRKELKHPARIINLYSQTETAGTVACYSLPEEHGTGSGIVPLGSPVAGATLHLLDEEGRPVPNGEIGEIVVAGNRLASGYLRRPDLTASRFIPVAGDDEAGEVMYRTGDLGRRRVDGIIEFVGRSDDRIKLRGYRIEPNDVASVLGEHPGVRYAAVVTRQDPAGHQRLVAYVAANPQALVSAGSARGLLSSAELRRFASERLPDYMVPSAFVLMAELPRSVNGKIDRLALPEPSWSQPQVAADFSLPQTELERRLTALWADSLGVEHVGTEDDFLELGGDSIKAMQILNRVQREFQVDLSASTLFSVSTVAALATAIENQRKPSSS